MQESTCMGKQQKFWNLTTSSPILVYPLIISEMKLKFLSFLLAADGVQQTALFFSFWRRSCWRLAFCRADFITCLYTNLCSTNTKLLWFFITHQTSPTFMPCKCDAAASPLFKMQTNFILFFKNELKF